MTTPSSIVVISWWSNCLGLTTLHRLATYTHDRVIRVVQVGKSPEAKARFRRHMPSGVVELDYPEDAPAEHSQVIRDLVLRQLQGEAGVWFFDHDVFLTEDCETWLRTADAGFEQTDICLCVHPSPESPAITQPAFWVSPVRWPAHITQVDPIPFSPRDASRRPDLFRHEGELRIPEKDTLMLAWETLSAIGRAERYHLMGEPPSELPPFPAHNHMGGLFLFSGPMLPPGFYGWMRATVTRFNQFYETCDWREDEDAELLRRLAEFQQWLDKGVTHG
ncbi:MAG: hypothetical protein K8I60_11515 [Anaerolineae bacterium]|nr:hypothetical protein [Anaerolineae bacterium]